MRTYRRAVPAFLFEKSSDDWLAILRIGLGIQLILYSVSARTGWIGNLSRTERIFSPRRISEAVMSRESPLIPRVSWLTSTGTIVGIPEHTTLWIIWSILLTVALLLVIGLFCRSSAITAWFLHLACVKSSDVLTYGMDNFLNIALFYLMLSPLPDSHSLEARIWPLRKRDPRMIGFFRRVLQLHLCAIYFFSGLAKCLGPDWWNGRNVWLALVRPPFDMLDPMFVARARAFLPIAGIAVCVIETAYPFLIWWRRSRPIWLAAVISMHIGIGLAMGMYLFASVMIILNLAAFGPGTLWRENVIEEPEARSAGSA